MGPSRIMGPSFTKAPYGHSFIEIDNYHVGFDDVPNVDELFKVPANCAGPLDALHLANAAQTGDLTDLIASAGENLRSEDHKHLKSLVDRVAQAGHLSPLVMLSERELGLGSMPQGKGKKVEAALQEVVSRGKAARWSRLAERHGGLDVLQAAEEQRRLGDGYPLWPLQFHCNHTGNGITFDSVVSPQTQKGVFYYDSTLNRSSTMYYDAETEPGASRF